MFRLTEECLEVALFAHSQKETLKPKDIERAARHLRGCSCRKILRQDRVPLGHILPEEERVQALASDDPTAP